MSSLQQRLTAVTDMQFAAIAAAAHLKSQLSELNCASGSGKHWNLPRPKRGVLCHLPRFLFGRRP
jgi:hypothetical protein